MPEKKLATSQEIFREKILRKQEERKKRMEQLEKIGIWGTLFIVGTLKFTLAFSISLLLTPAFWTVAKDQDKVAAGTLVFMTGLVLSWILEYIPVNLKLNKSTLRFFHMLPVTIGYTLGAWDAMRLLQTDAMSITCITSIAFLASVVAWYTSKTIGD